MMRRSCARSGPSGIAHHSACRGLTRTRASVLDASERCSKSPTTVPVIKVEESVKSTLESELEQQLQSLRWNDDPDRFDDLAYACLRKHLLKDELLKELQRMLDDPTSPSAVHFVGLPVDKNLPITPSEPPVAKESQIAEAMLMGFSRVWGRAAGFPGAGAQGICRDLIAVESTMYSSSSELVMHRDFGVADERVVPDFRIIYCIRPDKKRQVETLVADNREVLRALDPKDLSLLRTVPVKISGPGLGVPKLIVQGSDDLPVLSLFDLSVFGDEGSITAEDPEAVNAYHRAADVAMETAAEGVRLQEGEMLIINNSRATHARTRSPHETDGLGRWMKVTFVKAGAGPGASRYLEL